MTPLFRRLAWWLRQRRKEAELGEELQFHLEQEARERLEAGAREDEASFAARRDLGNEAKLREDVRALWTWRPLDELSQDLRFAFRTMFKHRAVAVFAILSLALGIGANTAIYSFMDAILLRSLPVGDPSSLVVMTWRSKRYPRAKSGEPSPFVMHSGDGSTYAEGTRLEGRIFPLPAFERLREVSGPVLSSIFVRFPAGKMTVLVDGEAELTDSEYVSGDFFRGIALSPGAGRLLLTRRRSRRRATGRGDQCGLCRAPIRIHRQRRRPQHSGQQHSVHRRRRDARGIRRHRSRHHDRTVSAAGGEPRARLHGRPTAFSDPNWYWAGIMGRLQDGVTREQAEQALVGAVRTVGGDDRIKRRRARQPSSLADR